MKIEIDEDIRVAKTISSKFYHSPKVFSRLKDLFNKSWQFVGNTDLLESNLVSIAESFPCSSIFIGTMYSWQSQRC